jgi:hypothetical protein
MHGQRNVLIGNTNSDRTCLINTHLNFLLTLTPIITNIAQSTHCLILLFDRIYRGK